MKNILMETVSHHILPQMLVSSLWVESNNLLRDYLRFMDDHLRESADRSLSEFTVRFVSLDMCIILLILSVFFNQIYEAVCVLLVSRVWRNEN